jgi:hypothetical protein
MGLQYQNLTPDTRHYMVEEINMAVQDGSIYLSPWLSDRGLADWAALLLAAAQNGNDDTLAAELRLHQRLKHTAERRKPKGGYTTYTVPATASETIGGLEKLRPTVGYQGIASK